jgi:hypothetical protein
MKNFRDVTASTSDIGAGFQFEFFCERCGETWRSPFKPYRKGQLTGLLSRSSALTGELGGWLTGLSRTVSNIYRASRGVGAFADAGLNRAREEAKDEAIALARDRYHACEACHKSVGDECFEERSGLCLDCAKGGGQRGAGGQQEGAVSCPNCQTPSQGGRFCHECGFDMASTHKSCPSCGATQPREARFCGDCGHGF